MTQFVAFKLGRDADEIYHFLPEIGVFQQGS